MGKKAIIISGGCENNIDYINNYINDDDFVVCADSGADIAKRCDILIGDLDSVINKNFAKLIKLPMCKDDTDTKYALNYTINQGYKDITLLNATGGRLDHMLANILLLEYANDRNTSLKIINDKNKIVLQKSCQIVYNIEKYQYVSIIPLDETVTGVTISSVKYPINNAILKRNDIISISNEAENDFTIDIKNGTILVIFSGD